MQPYVCRYTIHSRFLFLRLSFRVENLIQFFYKKKPTSPTAITINIVKTKMVLNKEVILLIILATEIVDVSAVFIGSSSRNLGKR